MTTTLEEHWLEMGQIQSRIEACSPSVGARKGQMLEDLHSFVERSEGVRDRLRRRKNEQDVKGGCVNKCVKSHLTLKLARDLAVKHKHESQDRGPWSSKKGDARFVVMPEAETPRRPPTLGDRGVRSSDVPGVAAPQVDVTQLARWWTRIEIHSTPDDDAPQIIDAVQFTRDVIGSWRNVFEYFGLDVAS